jgi:hypothetical protein
MRHIGRFHLVLSKVAARAHAFVRTKALFKTVGGIAATIMRAKDMRVCAADVSSGGGAMRFVCNCHLRWQRMNCAMPRQPGGSRGVGVRNASGPATSRQGDPGTKAERSKAGVWAHADRNTRRALAAH